MLTVVTVTVTNKIEAKCVENSICLNMRRSSAASKFMKAFDRLNGTDWICALNPSSIKCHTLQ